MIWHWHLRSVVSSKAFKGPLLPKNKFLIITFKACYHVTLNTLFHCFSHIMCPRQTDFFKVRNTKEPAKRWPEVPVLHVSALHSLVACPCRMLQVSEDPVLLVPFLYQVGQQQTPQKRKPLSCPSFCLCPSRVPGT